ncbi:MAG: DUF1820 family protein [Proteobacteria bacterium]|nr:DUF1820 family protein [Pseudomonadota bacterium]
MKDKNNKLYKVVFIHLGKVYEIYSRGITSSGLYGFVEVSELVFDHSDSMVVDPVEEKLRDEFSGVEVLHLPIQSVLRVEQVRKRGQCVIRDQKTGEKVTPFPVHK